MKRCSRENGFVLTRNTTGSENIECKTRMKIEPKARSSVKKCHSEQKSHLLVLDMVEKSTCLDAHPQYKLKAIFAPIVQACGSSPVGASIHEIVFCFFARESDFFTILEMRWKAQFREKHVVSYSGVTSSALVFVKLSCLLAWGQQRMQPAMVVSCLSKIQLSLTNSPPWVYNINSERW